MRHLGHQFFFQIKEKRRIHFNDFMTDVHARIHKAKELKKQSRNFLTKGQTWSPFKSVANDLIKNAWLLCFDEFQVANI